MMNSFFLIFLFVIDFRLLKRRRKSDDDFVPNEKLTSAFQACRDHSTFYGTHKRGQRERELGESGVAEESRYQSRAGLQSTRSRRYINKTTRKLAVSRFEFFLFKTGQKMLCAFVGVFSLDCIDASRFKSDVKPFRRRRARDRNRIGRLHDAPRENLSLTVKRFFFPRQPRNDGPTFDSLASPGKLFYICTQQRVNEQVFSDGWMGSIHQTRQS